MAIGEWPWKLIHDQSLRSLCGQAGVRLQYPTRSAVRCSADCSLLKVSISNLAVIHCHA